MENGFIVHDNMKNTKVYDGTTLKFGITVNNTNYIVKYPKDTVSSVYSEYVSSRFISSLGIPCHTVWIGLYNNMLMNILLDFTQPQYKLKPFESTRQSYVDMELKDGAYTYDYVLETINKHKKLDSNNKSLAIHRFWQMFICDAILGNRDRHPGNWGFLSKQNSYFPAPLYDNGGSLFPDLELRINEYIDCYNNNKEYKFISERAEKFPASLLQIETNRDGQSTRRTNYNEILSDLRINKTLAYEVRSIRENIGFNGIYERTFIILHDIQNIISYEYRRFYLIIICVRYLHLIERKSIEDSYRITIERVNNEPRQF